MYGQGYKNMTLELNASDDRGIDVVRRDKELLVPPVILERY